MAYQHENPRQVIAIPVKDAEELIYIPVDDLPDEETVLEVLRAELPPLHLWLQVAREYFKQGKLAEFETVLNAATSEEAKEFYKDSVHDRERIALLNAKGAYHTYQARAYVDNKQRRDEAFTVAADAYNTGSKIDINTMSLFVGFGQASLVKGDFENALTNFTSAEATDRGGTGPHRNVAPLLGLGAAMFQKGNYKEALKYYEEALRLHPSGPPAMRLGIALCHVRMQNTALARLALERVLELDPENVEALVALGTVEMNAGEAEQVQKGMEHMLQAYNVFPFCAPALNHLANHFFFRGQHKVVESLSHASMKATDDPLLRAQAQYNLARSLHVQGDFEGALRYYRLSAQEIREPADYVLPFYGVGQMLLKMGDYKAALTQFQLVLKVHPDCPEVLKGMGSIYGREPETQKQAVEFFRKAVESAPKDVDAWLDLGQLLANADPTGGLQAYEKQFVCGPLSCTRANLVAIPLCLGCLQALELYRARNEPISLELLNNIGVLCFELGRYESAKKLFEEALGEGPWSQELKVGRSGEGAAAPPTASAGEGHGGEADGPGTSGGGERQGGEGAAADGGGAVAVVAANGKAGGHEDGHASTAVALEVEKVTALFNYGRLLEKMHDFNPAARAYTLILEKFPKYTDCHVRLACISLAKKKLGDAMDMVKKGLGVQPDSLELRSMKALLEMRMEKVLDCKETLKGILALTGEKDSYANLALANWNYTMGLRAAEKLEKQTLKLRAEGVAEADKRSLAKDIDGEKEKLASHMHKARELYERVLQANPKNVFAVNGLGCIVAERGNFNAAREIFSSVQEALVGVGSVEAEDSWINLGHSLLASNDLNHSLQMYESCLKKFHVGVEPNLMLYMARVQYEANSWRACTRTLLHALHASPNSLALKFNAALSLQKAGIEVLKMDKCHAEQIRQAIADLKASMRLFVQLLGIGLDKKTIEKHVQYIQMLLRQGQDRLEAAERSEMAQKQKLAIEREKQLVEEKRREAEEARKLQEKKAREEEERRRVLEFEEKRLMIEEKFRVKAKLDVDDDGDGEGGRGGDEDGGEGRRKKPSRKKEKSEKKEKKDRKSKKKGKKQGGDEEEEDDGGAWGRAAEDEDEEEEEEGEAEEAEGGEWEDREESGEEAGAAGEGKEDDGEEEEQAKTPYGSEDGEGAAAGAEEEEEGQAEEVREGGRKRRRRVVEQQEPEGGGTEEEASPGREGLEDEDVEEGGGGDADMEDAGGESGEEEDAPKKKLKRGRAVIDSDDDD